MMQNDNEEIQAILNELDVQKFVDAAYRINSKSRSFTRAHPELQSKQPEIYWNYLDFEDRIMNLAVLFENRIPNLLKLTSKDMDWFKNSLVDSLGQFEAGLSSINPTMLGLLFTTPEEMNQANADVAEIRAFQGRVLSKAKEIGATEQEINNELAKYKLSTYDYSDQKRAVNYQEQVAKNKRTHTITRDL